MYYRPRFPNGQLIPLSWPIAIYRRINHMCWPLEENATRGQIWFDYFLSFVGVLIFLFHQDAEFRFIRLNLTDFNEWTKALPPFIALHEIFLRCLHCVSHKKSLRHVLQTFYTKIQISKEEHPQLSRSIGRQLVSTKVITVMYILAVNGYMYILFNDIIYQRKDYIHPMMPFFESKALYVFIPVMSMSIWYAMVADVLVFGEITIVAELLIHLNARYLILQEDLLEEADYILNNTNPYEMARKFREMIVRMVKRNVELNQFTEQVEKLYTFRMFVMFSFSATLLCVLSFMAYKNPSAVFYFLWFMAKTFDLLVIGNLGSTVERTTNNISTMYYRSKWEQAIYKSKNTRENVKLLKIIALAIEINSRPMYLTGMKHFKITLITVLKILQGAFSYFTFATSMEK